MQYFEYDICFINLKKNRTGLKLYLKFLRTEVYSALIQHPYLDTFRSLFA